VNPDALAVAERALALICLYQAAGAAFYLGLFAAHAPRSGRRVRRLAAAAALCAIVLVLLRLPLEADRMAGDFVGWRDTALLRLALFSSQGAATCVQITGLALIAGGCRGRAGAPAARERAWALPLALLGGVLAATALVLTGHTSVDPRRALLAPLLALHLLIGAFWFGALGPLWLALRYEAPADAAALLRAFSAPAVWLVPCIALAGLGMAWLLVAPAQLLQHSYGRLLLAKLSLFALALAFAAWNRSRLVPALALEPEAARPRLQGSIGCEALLLAAVLALTSALTTLYSPAD